MLLIDQRGRAMNAKIRLAISPGIERGALPIVHGIIVHQTDSSTARSTLDGYKAPRANGAHFLIDKDGTIYQTASLFKKTHHVGFIKSRCLVQKSCSPAELKALRGKRVGREIGHVEMKKPFPSRFPNNDDSIGIENVSLARSGVFEPLTPSQQASLRWLLSELETTLRVSPAEVYRHPDVSWKLESEAASARLQ